MYAGQGRRGGPGPRDLHRARGIRTRRSCSAAFPNIQADRRTLETIPGSPPDLRDPPPGCRFHPRCPVAMDVCREVVPPEVTFPDGVRVACHLYPDGPGRRRAHQRGRRGRTARDRRPPAARRPDAQRRAARGRRRDATSSGSSGLEVHFPIRGGLRRHAAAPARGRRPGGRRHRPHASPRARSWGSSASPARGKTTTGRVIVKLTRQTAGRITFDGAGRHRPVGDQARCATYRRRVQLIFQDPYETLNPKQTIHDFVAEPLEVNGLAPRLADREARVSAALEAAGLAGATSPSATRTSCRAASASASSSPAPWSMDPELVVADEPVSMLDVSIRTELLRLMLDLRQERGLTYLFITHDLSLAWVIADRIAVMYLGKIMEIGPADQVIRKSPHNPYTAALVSVSPTPDPPTRRRAAADDPRRRDARRGARPDRAAGSIRAARWRSTAARPRSRRCSTSAAGSRPPAGWPRAAARCRSCRSRTPAELVGGATPPAPWPEAASAAVAGADAAS